MGINHRYDACSDTAILLCAKESSAELPGGMPATAN